MTGMVALEFAKSKQTTLDMLGAFIKANAGVAAYRNMPWQRMPSFESVSKMQEKATKPELVAEPSKGMLFLPKKDVTYLSDFETAVPGLYSADLVFRDRMKAVLKDLQTEWKGKLKSTILGAPAGSGKSTLISALKADLGSRHGLQIVDLSDPKSINWEDAEGFVRGIAEAKDPDKGQILCIIDEALKGEMGKKLKTHGVVLLNSAHANGIRFFLIDALFLEEGKTPVSSEITSRCRPYYLPSFEERPIDIPYIVAGFMFSLLEPSIRSISFEGDFLLAMTNSILSTPNPRVLCNWAEDAVRNARLKWNNKEPLNIKFDHLSRALRPAGKAQAIAGKQYEFRRAI
jgi:energy-coupling factor transporter ATP-binding protein EcfA2